MFNSSSDPFVQALKSIHYLVVRLPRSDMAPLQILTRSGDSLVALGEIANVMVAGSAPLPAIRLGVPVAPINGSRTGQMKIGLGLSLLGNIIGAMGGSRLGFDVAYRRATSATFEFQNVTEESVGIDLLDQFLSAADINPANAAISTLLDAASVYVVTSVLKSDIFVFDATSEQEGDIKLDVPVIQEAVGVNVTVKPQSESKTTIAYQGKIPLAFAFKAIQLFFDDGRFTSFKPAQGLAAAFEPFHDPGAEKVDYLLTADTFARIA